MCNVVLVILYLIVDNSAFVKQVLLYHTLGVGRSIPIRDVRLEPAMFYLFIVEGHVEIIGGHVEALEGFIDLSSRERLKCLFVNIISRKTQSVPPARKDTCLSVSFYCAIL